jgi:hypothetical protein
MVKRIGKG